ncbi:MAG: hypothetical protein H7Y02_05225 [Candidatus Obscuribacterales bacterium]|nr:hypothetical protein [Steroidobacteraceae bacterium]
MKRRMFLASLAAALGGVIALSSFDAAAGPVRRARRRVRRRVIRRRVRRHAFTRVVLGRSLWVVPLGLAVGWELMHDDRIVVVKETKIIEKEGAKVEVAVVETSDGKKEEISILREDNAQNRKSLEGSVLPDDDKSTPGVKSETEEAVED